MQAAFEFQKKLTLCLRILRETRQAVSCDALAQNDANMHADYDDRVDDNDDRDSTQGLAAPSRGVRTVAQIFNDVHLAQTVSPQVF